MRRQPRLLPPGQGCARCRHDLFEISQPSISRHLRVLRETGLVRVVPEGRKRIYRLDPEPLREIDGWLERYRRFWARKLDALESHLDEETTS